VFVFLVQIHLPANLQQLRIFKIDFFLLKRRIYLNFEKKDIFKVCSFKRQKWQICLALIKGKRQKWQICLALIKRQKVKDYPHSIFELLKNEKGVSVIFD